MQSNEGTPKNAKFRLIVEFMRKEEAEKTEAKKNRIYYFV